MSVNQDDILRITVRLNLPEGVEAQNIFVVQYNGVSPSSDSDVILDLTKYIEDLYGSAASMMSDVISNGRTDVHEVDGLGVVQRLLGDFVSAVVYASVAEMLPHGVAAMIRGTTLTPRVEGRKYLPGFTEDRQDGGVWSAGTLVNLVSVAVNTFQNFVGGTTGEGYTPGVISTKLLDFEPTAGSQVIDNICDYQRRRKEGVGS